MVFEEWKRAWRQAVENFQNELRGDDAAPPRIAAMRRELGSARDALGRLDAEIRATRGDAAAEREAEQVCHRREALARNIDDEETERLAREFAARHAERAGVLERKVDVLVAERALIARDLEGMEAAYRERAGEDALPDFNAPDVFEQRKRQEIDFGKLDRQARERAAEDRLEEMKKKMK